MMLNTSTVEIDESGISISKIDNIVTVRGSLQNHHAEKVKAIFSIVVFLADVRIADKGDRNFSFGRNDILHEFYLSEELDAQEHKSFESIPYEITESDADNAMLAYYTTMLAVSEL
ncbi:MAG: hypothetical protein OXH16_04805 [Gemmatimonadetes bacterium]|nr:hypothetical protein [Gemmatimonadota bacterium]